jgi:hypothetical protein
VLPKKTEALLIEMQPALKSRQTWMPGYPGHRKSVKIFPKFTPALEWRICNLDVNLTPVFSRKGVSFGQLNRGATGNGPVIPVNRPGLFLQLRQSTPFFGNINMGKFRGFRGSVPVFLSPGYNDHIPGPDQFFFLFGGDKSLAGSNNQNLFAVMGVKFVSDPPSEVNHVDIKFLAAG